MLSNIIFPFPFHSYIALLSSDNIQSVCIILLRLLTYLHRWPLPLFSTFWKIGMAHPSLLCLVVTLRCISEQRMLWLLTQLLLGCCCCWSTNGLLALSPRHLAAARHQAPPLLPAQEASYPARLHASPRSLPAAL